MISGKAECGMWYAVKRGGSAVAYCALSVKCGTRDEEGFHSGIAHFAEHTIFKGTQRRSASVISSYLDRLGGELNAFTTKEEIVFHATVLKEDLPKAAALLFELVLLPTFPREEVEIEKGVVTDEIHSCKDSPAEDIYDRFEEMLFAGHPLSGNILGTRASVRKIDSGELHRFVKERFKPCRMAFSVVADIDEAKLERDVKRLAEKFIGQVGNPDCSCAPDLSGRFLRERFDKTLNKRNHQANCIIGGFAPSLYCDPDRVVTVLLCNILGGPASNSILNSVLREKRGWVYGVECSYTQYADTGVVAVSFGCDRNNLERCRGEILKILGRLKDTPLSERRLKAAKKQLLGQMAIGGDNGETQCLSMGKSLLAYGKITGSKETKALIDSISSTDIQRVAQQIFAEENLSVLTYV